MFCSSFLSFVACVAFHSCSESSCIDDSAFRSCFLMFSSMLNFLMSTYVSCFSMFCFFFGIFINQWSRYFDFTNSGSLSPFSFCLNVLFSYITLEIYFVLIDPTCSCFVSCVETCKFCCFSMFMVNLHNYCY